MDSDEFYRQPAAVPFKWEIKPGVPKNHHRLPHLPGHQKLKPPPNSIHLSSRTRSDRWQFSRSNLREPDLVSSGCFPAPLSSRKSSKRVTRKPEPDYTSESENLSRWSVSTGKSPISPFRYSVSSSPASFSSYSYQSSPRPIGDSEWAGFGLF